MELQQGAAILRVFGDGKWDRSRTTARSAISNSTPLRRNLFQFRAAPPQGCSQYLNENWDINHGVLIVLKSKRDFGAGQISHISGLNSSHTDPSSLFRRTTKLLRRTQIAYASLENKTVEGSEEGKAESTSKDSNTVFANGKSLSLDAPTSSPFASGKISSKIAAKAVQSGENESTSSKMKNPPSGEAVRIAPRNSTTTAPKDATKVEAGPTLPPRPPIFSATPALKPSAIKPKSLIENGTQGAFPTGKASPFVADRLKSQAASPPSQYNRTSSGRTMINSGKQVLEAFKQGEKEGKTTKFGQPIVPKNIFEDVRRTPEEMEADKFQFKLSPVQFTIRKPRWETLDAGAVDDGKLRTELKAKIAGIRSNAEKVKDGRGGALIQHTLGVDLGDVKTGLSISLGGFAPQPLTVVRQRGDKLLQSILQVALREKADEFVVGLPKAWDGKDTEQANKSRSFAGRLANLAARRGWRVYLQDEYGTSQDALSYMIELGSNRLSRKGQLDAYAAMALLCNYFEAFGTRAQIVIPRHLELQHLLCQGPPKLVVTDVEDDYDNFDF